jgi:hypothetical protein
VSAHPALLRQFEIGSGLPATARTLGPTYSVHSAQPGIALVQALAWRTGIVFEKQRPVPYSSFLMQGIANLQE